MGTAEATRSYYAGLYETMRLEASIRLKCPEYELNWRGWMGMFGDTSLGCGCSEDGEPYNPIPEMPDGMV